MMLNLNFELHLRLELYYPLMSCYHFDKMNILEMQYHRNEIRYNRYLPDNNLIRMVLRFQRPKFYYILKNMSNLKTLHLDLQQRQPYLMTLLRQMLVNQKFLRFDSYSQQMNRLYYPINVHHHLWCPNKQLRY